MDAIRDLSDEVGRTEGPRPVVLSALVQDAAAKVGAIQELVRPRRPKAAKVDA